MKKYLEEEVTVNVDSCATTNTRNLWLVGAALVLLAALFCATLFKTTNKPLPVQDTAGPLMAFPGAQQAAFFNPNCAVCPNVTQCFPQGTGGAQQVALVSPNCFTCPSVTQCFPQGSPSAQQVAFQQNTSMLTCPYCNFAYNDSSAGARGFSRCPRCLGMVTLSKKQTKTPPPIFRDAVMTHEYRGVCENCHIIKPDIAIQASSKPPHEYRGVCSNCHTILGLKAKAQ